MAGSVDMKRREFLKRIGIVAGTSVIAPAIIINELQKGDSAEDWNKGSDWVKGNGWKVERKWQHHEEIRSIEGQKYKISFDYRTENNTQLEIIIDNPKMTGYNWMGLDDQFHYVSLGPKEATGEITDLIIKEVKI